MLEEEIDFFFLKCLEFQRKIKTLNIEKFLMNNLKYFGVGGHSKVFPEFSSMFYTNSKLKCTQPIDVLYIYQISICTCELKFLKYTHAHLEYNPLHKQSIVL